MPDTIEFTRHKIDFDAYFRMAELGILGRGDRVELINGEIIDMAPIGRGHSAIVGRLNRTLVLEGGTKTIVWPQNSVALDRFNHPEPDFLLLRPRDDFYGTGERPNAQDVLLVIEVSDSSLAYDRKVKLPLYAQFGIGEYWIVDVKARLVEVYRDPDGNAYRTKSTHGAYDQLTLALAPDITIGLGQLFG